jgi:hypothetical protein
MATPKVTSVQVVIHYGYEDGMNTTISSAVYKKEIRKGLFFTDDETKATMLVAYEAAHRVFEKFTGAGMHKYVKGLGQPPIGPQPSVN